MIIAVQKVTKEVFAELFADSICGIENNAGFFYEESLIRNEIPEAIIVCEEGNARTPTMTFKVTSIKSFKGDPELKLDPEKEYIKCYVGSFTDNYLVNHLDQLQELRNVISQIWKSS
jgi:hypothetical protein